MGRRPPSIRPVALPACGVPGPDPRRRAMSKMTPSLWPCSHLSLLDAARDCRFGLVELPGNLGDDPPALTTSSFAFAFNPGETLHFAPHSTWPPMAFSPVVCSSRERGSTQRPARRLVAGLRGSRSRRQAYKRPRLTRHNAAQGSMGSIEKSHARADLLLRREVHRWWSD